MSSADATTPSIYIATPCFGGLVTTAYMTSVIRLMRFADENGFAVSLHLLGKDSLITRSRNTLVADFMGGPESHLMFIDADIGFEPRQVHRMLMFDQDVVAGMYPVKALKWDHPAALRQKEGPETATLQYVGKFCEGAELERRGPFATGVYAATGFMLVKRGVFERLIAAYPETAYAGDHVYVGGGTASRTAHALFECLIDPQTGEYLSEDFGFCRRWRAIGGTIWLDVEGGLTHTGPHDFVGDPALRFGASGA